MIKNIKLAAVLGAAVAVFGLSAGEAQAQTLETYSCSGSYNGTTYTSYCAGTEGQASTITTSTAVLATAATNSAKLVSNRVANAVAGNGSFNVAANGFSASTGQSAGDYSNKLGTWVAGQWSDLEDENTATAFDGQVFNVMGGVDYRIQPKVVVGLSIGYEDVDLDTAYNGFGGSTGTLEGEGYTIAPYIGAEIAPNVTASFTAGYSDIEYDTLRYDPFTGNANTGNTDADRYFVDASVSGSHLIDTAWHLRGKVGVFYASEDKDAFTETEANTGNTVAVAAYDADYGQATIDAKLGYVFDMVEPYVLAGIGYDYAKDESPVGVGQSKSSLDDEDFEAKFGAGLDFNLGHGITAGLEAYTVEFRDDYDQYTVTGGLRMDF